MTTANPNRPAYVTLAVIGAGVLALGLFAPSARGPIFPEASAVYVMEAIDHDGNAWIVGAGDSCIAASERMELPANLATLECVRF